MSILILPVLAAIQASILVFIPVLGYSIDLVLMAVVARSILYGRQQGVWWGIVGGICLDLVSVAPFGTHMLAASVVALVTSIRGRDILHAWAFYPMLAGGLSTFLFDLIIIAVFVVFRREAGWQSVPFTITLPRALFNALAMAPIFWVSYRRSSRGRSGEVRGLGL